MVSCGISEYYSLRVKHSEEPPASSPYLRPHVDGRYITPVKSLDTSSHAFFFYLSLQLSTLQFLLRFCNSQQQTFTKKKSREQHALVRDKLFFSNRSIVYKF